MALESFIHALPKVELHLHLEGAVAAPTVIDLARKYGIDIPDFGADSDLYAFEDLAAFLRVYDIVCRAMRAPADFHRVTYETLMRCASSNVRYVEFFFSPQAHVGSGIRYGQMLDGILAGMQDAERDHGLISRLIPAHNRELGPDAGQQFLAMVCSDRRDAVIGIGLDYLEADYPPGPYAAVYAAAKRAGLRTTAHAGESGPASNIRDSLQLLGCDRIDHGYHVTDDPGLSATCRDSRVGFTCCPSTTAYTTIWRDLDAPDHPIRRMRELGLCVTLNTDDPGLFRTDMNGEYRIAVERLGFSPRDLVACTRNALEIAWLDPATRLEWQTTWAPEMDRLLAEFTTGAGTAP